MLRVGQIVDNTDCPVCEDCWPISNSVNLCAHTHTHAASLLTLTTYTIIQHIVWTQPSRKGLGNNLAQKCLAGMPGLLNSENFLFQIFNTIGQALLQFSKFLPSTLYSLLVGWSDVRSLINTDGSIPALKTLPGKDFPQTLPCGLGLGSRLYNTYLPTHLPPLTHTQTYNYLTQTHLHTCSPNTHTHTQDHLVWCRSSLYIPSMNQPPSHGWSI